MTDEQALAAVRLYTDELGALRKRVAELEELNDAAVRALDALEQDCDLARQRIAALDDLDARALAEMAWFCSRGASGAGQWPGDPGDFAKQIKARDEFDAWWNATKERGS